LPASPIPWRPRRAARSDKATPRATDLWRKAEPDLCAGAAGRPPDAEGRPAQVPGRRGYESGTRVVK